MTFYLLIIVTLCIYGVTIYQKPEFCRDYISRDNTLSIRGIFVLLVIAQHFVTYTELNSPYDSFYFEIRNFLGQNIVSIFLFYSGYGVYESIKKKGKEYIIRMPVKRMLLTLLHFDLAVLAFYFVDRILGAQYPFRTILLAFTGWTSIGNSNWYVFAVLCAYMFTWFSFILFYKYPIVAIVLTNMFSIIYIVVVHHYRPNEWYCYNTVLCYSAGMWYSYFKERLEEFLLLDEGQHHYYITLFVNVIIVLFLRPYIGSLRIYIIWTLCFTSMTILMTMKIAVHNKILHWLGVYTFELYILQRIPMMVFARWGGIRNRPYIFLVLSIAGTVVLAFIFKKVCNYIDEKILNMKKKYN